MPLHEELAKLHQVMVKQAHEILERQGYIQEDAQGSKAILTETLVLLAHCAPPSIITRGICTITTLLECEAADHTTEGVSKGIIKRVELLLGSAK